MQRNTDITCSSRGSESDLLALTYRGIAQSPPREPEGLPLCLKLMSKENNDPG